MADPDELARHEEIETKASDRGQQPRCSSHEGKGADILQRHEACHEYGQQEARAEARHAQCCIDQANGHTE